MTELEASQQAAPSAPGVQQSLTTLQRISGWLLLGVFLPIIAVPVPLDWLLTELEIPLPKFSKARPEKIKPEDYFNGAAAPKLEKKWLRESHVARWLTPRHNEVAFLLAGRTAPASWVGKDRWLSGPARTRDRHQAYWDRAVEYNADAIEKVDRFVDSRGAKLAVALVPNRTRVYADMLYPSLGTVPPARAAFIPTLAAELRRRNVVVVDLTDTLMNERESGEPVFYKDDHHWTPFGARAAARGVISELPESHRSLLVRTSDRPLFHARWIPDAPTEHSLVYLLGFIPKGKLEASFYARGPRAYMPGKGARGFRRSCATYWSTSFGRFGSPKFFANEAGCPVRIVYRDGTGSGWAPVRDMRALSRQRHLRGRHLIVWEIPEYHMCDGPADKPSTLSRVHDYFAKRSGEKEAPRW